MFGRSIREEVIKFPQTKRQRKFNLKTCNVCKYPSQHDKDG